MSTETRVARFAYDYDQSRRLRQHGFYTLLMAAIAEADSGNLERLRDAFPATVQETQARYNAPGACLTVAEFRTKFGKDPDEQTRERILSFGYERGGESGGKGNA